MPVGVDFGEAIQVLDFNGDGLDDIAMVNYLNGHSDSGVLHIYQRTWSAQRNRLLVKIDRRGTTRNGMAIPGEEFDIAYRPISDPAVYSEHDIRAFPDTFYPSAKVNSKVWVVSSTWRRDDAHSTGIRYDRTNYSYLNARRDLRGRGFLGFGGVTANQVDKGVITTTTYDLGSKEHAQSFYPYVGVPVAVDTMSSYSDPLGGDITRKHSLKSTLTTVHTGGGSFFVYPQTATDTQSETYADNSTHVLSSSTTIANLDANGNVLTSATTYDGGSSEAVSHVYTYVDDGTWPRVTSDVMSETSATPAAGMLGRTRTLTFDSDWNLRSIVALPSGNDRGEQTLTISYTPTAEGMPGIVLFGESAARGSTTRQISYAYDSSEHAFPSVETDGLQHVRRTAYHPSLGVLAIAEDENRQQTTFQYDGFGRLRSIRLPTGEGSTISYVSQSGDPYAPAAADTLVRTLRRDNSGAATVVEVNWRGKPTLRRTWSRPDGRPVWETYGYDLFDRLSFRTSPSFDPVGASKHLLQYDVLDRLVNETRPDGSVWRYAHRGLETGVQDLKDKVKVNVTTLDGRGRVVKISESSADVLSHLLNTRYEYGPFGGVYRITDAAGNFIIHETNRLGMLWHNKDPDAGERYYSYNAFGQVEVTSTPKFTERYAYDAIGRLQAATTGATGTKLTWDAAANGIGRIAQLDSPDGISTVFGYSTAGQTTSRTWAVDGEVIGLFNTFDSVGRLDTVTYPPSGSDQHPLIVKYKYDPRSGALLSIVDAATGAPYWTYEGSDASGAFPTERFGSPSSGMMATSTESAETPKTLGRVRISKADGTVLRDVSYTSDGRRNITSCVDGIKHVSQSFGYDSLNRLRTWTFSDKGTIAQSMRYIYDDAGNLTKRSALSGGGTSLSFTFDATKAGPHQLMSSTIGSYGYDGNGRQTAAPGRTLEYNSNDLPTVVSSSSFAETFSFSYDGNGRRVVKKEKGGDVTLAVGDLFEKRKPKAGSPAYLNYIIGPEGAVAALVTTGGAKRTYYLHHDQRASVDLIYDDKGRVVDQLAYDPFGARILETPPERPAGRPVSPIDRGFTGQMQDDERALALVDMKGRIYDPAQYRFLSVDPVFDGIGNQALNRYAYVGNNPINVIDPTGFDEEQQDSSDQNQNESHSCGPYCSRVIGTYRGAEDSSGPGGPAAPSTAPPPPPPPPNYDGRDAGMLATGALMTPAVRNAAFDLVAKNNKDMPKALATVSLGIPAAGALLATAPEALFAAGVRLMLRAPWLYYVGYHVGAAIVDAPTLGPAPGAIRGLSRSGGIFARTVNEAGGEVWTAAGKIAQNDFASLVNSGLYKGVVNILTGVHGTAEGRMFMDIALHEADVARFGNLPGVNIHFLPDLTLPEITNILRAPDTTIGAFCDSGICLAPFR